VGPRHSETRVSRAKETGRLIAGPSCRCTTERLIGGARMSVHEGALAVDGWAAQMESRLG
jgi:hypothetical protein